MSLMTRKKTSIRHLFLLSSWSLALTLYLLLGLAAPAVKAHESAFPLRYVAPNGLDSGDCDDPAAPCRTILYAINQALPGDQIRVAAGTYIFDRGELPLLLSQIIPVKGGYSPADAFSLQAPLNNPTYLIGLESQYSQALQARGFTLIQDAKEIELRQTIHNQTTPQLTASAETTTFTPCVAGRAGDYPCQGLDLLARLSLNDFSLKPVSANDIWGFVDQDDGREYAIIGLSNGTAVIDVTDPLQPVEVGVVPGITTIWRDVKVYQFYNDAENRWNAYAYVTADGVQQGLQIIDLSELPAAISLAATYTAFLSAHNIYLGDVDYTTGITHSSPTAYAYIMGSNLGSDLNQGGARLLDLSNPVAPVEIAAPVEAGYVHDGTTLVITDSRTIDCHAGHSPCELFVDFNESTVDIWDVTDKAGPARISSTPYEGASYTHSGWWSADKQFIFIQDEFDEWSLGHNTRLRVLDISDLTTPFISRVWEGSTLAIDHNGFAKANHYYMSNYRRGLTVLDVAEPNNPRKIAFFDTFPGSDSANFNGAWGVYPYLPSGVILVSDIERGLFLLREQGLALSKSGPGQVEPGHPLTYTLTLTNNGLFPATNIVMTDTLPTGALYLDGGARLGNVISWSLASLAPGAMTQTTLTVLTTSNAILINHDYGVQAEGSISALSRVRVAGSQPVVTVVGQVDIYLPLILKN